MKNLSPSEVIFKAIVNEIYASNLKNTYSVRADITSINSGEKNGINKRHADYFHSVIGFYI